MLEEELGRMSPDLEAIEAYRKKEADYQTKAQELESATAERDEVRCILLRLASFSRPNTFDYSCNSLLQANASLHHKLKPRPWYMLLPHCSLLHCSLLALRSSLSHQVSTGP